MVRRFAISLVACSMIAVSAPHAGAEDSPSGCTIAGGVGQKPGVAYAPQSGTYEIQGVMDCTSSTPAHGVVNGTGTGTIGCLGGSSTAVLNVAWDGGQASTMNVQLGDFTYGTGGYGTVDDGIFKGSRVAVSWAREAAGAEMRCATGGVKSYEFAGGVAFG
jgi:hypothetical protein